MKIRLSAPSKTFLMGEYLALKKGPSLILNTEPRFVMEVECAGEGICQGIHPHSPAGLWIRSQNFCFQKVNVHFIDPHKGMGGFGASSAQFLLAYAWSLFQDQPIENWTEKLNMLSLWNCYQSVFSEEKSQALQASGADVLGQALGSISAIQLDSLKGEALHWDFEGKDYLVGHTGRKINTHTHLKDLELPGEWVVKLRNIVHQGTQAITQNNWSHLMESIHAYALELKIQGFVTKESQEVVESLQAHPAIEAVKACGAMGADTILSFFEKKDRDEVVEMYKKLGLSPVAHSNQSSEGLEIKIENVINPNLNNTPSPHLGSKHFDTIGKRTTPSDWNQGV